MSMSIETKSATIREWRELGFFYDYMEQAKSWIFIGSVIGIGKLYSILKEYSEKPENEKIGEHDHYGPYMYLKIGTRRGPCIDENGIFGTLQDIAKLADIIQTCLSNAKIEDVIEIDREFSENNQSSIKIKILEEDFDPASSDPLLVRG